MGRQQERGTQNAFWALTSAESAQFDNQLRPACGFVLPLFCDSPVMCLSLAERTAAGSVFYRPRLASGENNLQEIPMGQFTKPWSELTFTDNFIFCKVMEDEVLCRRMIEILLGINVSKIEYLATEKQIENYYDARAFVLMSMLKIPTECLISNSRQVTITIYFSGAATIRVLRIQQLQNGVLSSGS